MKRNQIIALAAIIIISALLLARYGIWGSVSSDSVTTSSTACHYQSRRNARIESLEKQINNLQDRFERNPDKQEYIQGQIDRLQGKIDRLSL